MADKTEVKSCDKTGQVDKCKNCESRVFKYQKKCPICGSSKIKRKDDTKWLFSIRDEKELNQYLNLDRVLLILIDYPNFDKNDFSSIRIESFEIYPKDSRMSLFCELIKNHYFKIYRPKADKGQKTNAMNLHPNQIQFYQCNPIKTFSCIIKDIDSTNPSIEIDENNYVPPEKERDISLKSEDLPTKLLKSNEWKTFLMNSDFENEIKPLLKKEMSKSEFEKLSDKEKSAELEFLTEELKKYITLREIVSKQQTSHYQRG